jgi:hypothetical protein
MLLLLLPELLFDCGHCCLLILHAVALSRQLLSSSCRLWGRSAGRTVEQMVDLLL